MLETLAILDQVEHVGLAIWNVVFVAERLLGSHILAFENADFATWLDELPVRENELRSQSCFDRLEVELAVAQPLLAIAAGKDGLHLDAFSFLFFPQGRLTLRGDFGLTLEQPVPQQVCLVLEHLVLTYLGAIGTEVYRKRLRRS